MGCNIGEKNKLVNSNSLKYAKGFNIEKEGDRRILKILAAYQGSKDISSYQFDRNPGPITIQIPIKRIVPTSTTHIPMIELLGEEQSIVGFPNTNFVSSEKTRRLIEAGKIKEVGIQGNLNTEILLALKPDAVVSYAVNGPEKSLQLIERSNIPVIYNGDWLENSPLGKAEWIKVFGLLFDKEKEADSIFNAIEEEYLKAVQLANTATIKPAVLSGAIMSNDIWNLPAGESYVAQFLKDSNTHYLWEETDGKGSLNLSFESVFEKAKSADFWIAPGYFSAKEQMVQANKLYAEFDAYKNDRIYTPTSKQGSSGGVLYYELATVRPDLVLKDIIKITHPGLLPDYELTFFEKMK
ncbi:MAG: ABC transporter substrate-binding protein [Flavobacteriaceae bacterium]|nr:ABC transporter substrate-binding protein [Flavobacteriaceae bacterium]|tara:strand:- start:119196 stop:120254 length:1059 start_codon:yes stop_codon:yes gene_type:complete